MATSDRDSSENAFSDNFTSLHGNSFIVMVEPVFDEQITEAATFIARSKPESERADFISNLTEQARIAAPHTEINEDDDNEDKEQLPESEEIRQEKRKVIQNLVQSLQATRLEGPDREFEGFSNLVLCLILSLFSPEQEEYSNLILTLVDVLAINSVRSSNPSTPSRYTSLAALFNSLPLDKAATLKLSVLLKLIAYASSNDDFTIIKPVLARFESWLVQWGFGHGAHGEEEGNAAVASVVKSLSKGKKSEARSILLQHLSTPSQVSGVATTPSTSASALASRLIALSLAQPDYFDFSSLATLTTLSTPSVTELRTLLDIFTSGDITGFVKFVSANSTIITQQELDAESLGRKLKLLALAELCSARVGELVSYKEIAETLRLENALSDDGEQVETWVIDAIRAHLISGRLSQSLLSFHVTRAAPRAFTATHWNQLQGRLQGWRVSLDDILDSVHKAVSVDGGVGVGATEIRREIAA